MIKMKFNKQKHSWFIISLLCLVIGFYSFGYIYVYWNLHRQFKKDGIGKIREIAQHKDIKNFDFFSSNLSSDIPYYELLNVIKVPNDWLLQQNNKFMFVKKHEIKYFGEMFDIIKYDVIDDTAYFLCISDKNEDVLERTFIEHFTTESNSKSKNLPIKYILDKTSYDAIFQKIIKSSYNREREVVYLDKSFFLKENTVETQTPPPKLFI